MPDSLLKGPVSVCCMCVINKIQNEYTVQATSFSLKALFRNGIFFFFGLRQFYISALKKKNADKSRLLLANENPGLCVSSQSHLLMGDGDLFLIGQLHQGADVCAQVGLTANEKDACAGAEI